MPLLFQRRFGTENRPSPPQRIRNMLNRGLAAHRPDRCRRRSRCMFSPHDFRRIFITDAIMSGLPPHIAQVIGGHKRHQRHARATRPSTPTRPSSATGRSSPAAAPLRPSEEYRTPTDDEWEEFLGHFERRKVAPGTCGRAFAHPLHP